MRRRNHKIVPRVFSILMAAVLAGSLYPPESAAATAYAAAGVWAAGGTYAAEEAADKYEGGSEQGENEPRDSAIEAEENNLGSPETEAGESGGASDGIDTENTGSEDGGEEETALQVNNPEGINAEENVSENTNSEKINSEEINSEENTPLEYGAQENDADGGREDEGAENTREAVEQDAEWFLPQLCDTMTVTDYYVYPGFSAYGLTDGVKVEEKGAEASDGTVFTKRFSAGSPAKDESGNPKFDSQRSMKIEVEELSNIVVYCQSSGSTRILRLVNESGQTIKDFTAVEKG